MASMKTLAAKMADEGLTSFIVTLRDGDDATPYEQQYWAEDSDHATEQCEAASPDYQVVMVETQADYEARTGVMLDYGRRENV